jgi:hypothetical protein
MQSATGNRSASILAGTPVADPSPVGGSLRSRRFLFRLSFAPCLMGGKTGQCALGGGREYAAFLLRPPSVPGGDTGRKGEKGTRVYGRSRWSLKGKSVLVGAHSGSCVLNVHRLSTNIFLLVSAEKRFRVWRIRTKQITRQVTGWSYQRPGLSSVSSPPLIQPLRSHQLSPERSGSADPSGPDSMPGSQAQMARSLALLMGQLTFDRYRMLSHCCVQASSLCTA